MRRRRAARLLVLNDAGGVLLFRFIAMPPTPTQRSYWGTPGGGLDEGESFEQAAVRELLEETGIQVSSVGGEIGRREAVLFLPTGEQVLSEERYFFVRVPNCAISKSGWTREERDVTLDYRWWSLADLRDNAEEVRPNNLIEMFEACLKGCSQSQISETWYSTCADLLSLLLESKSDDGSYLIMSSGSVYEVVAGDEIDRELWLPPAEVVICSRSITVQGRQYLVYDIINKDENEKVSTMKRR